MDEELAKALEFVLCFSANLRKGSDFDFTRKLVGGIFYVMANNDAAPQTEAEFEQGREYFDRGTEKLACILKRLPEDVLEGVDDLNAYAWGFMTKEQRTRLREYVKENFPHLTKLF